MEMTREELEKKWALSSYNESTDEQLDYYLNERKCNIGDIAYIFDASVNELCKLEILNIIRRMDDPKKYDILIMNDDILIDGEDRYGADTSAEFITDNDCYLAWFKYVKDDE